MKIKANEYNTGEIMKFVRQWTGLTQRQFAEKIGKSTATVRDYEQNRSNYSFELLMNIAEEFNLKITIEKDK